jgi:hypothetical protein
MYRAKPKEFLIQKTANNKKKYTESHCPTIFKELDFELLEKNCNYFKEFHKVFKSTVKPK